MQPSHAKEIQYLDFLVRRFLVRSQFLDRFPGTLKHSLIEQTERRLFLRDLAAPQDLVYVFIEIACPDFDVAKELVALSVPRFWLKFLQPSQCSEAFLALFTEKEVSKPLRFTLQYKFRRPCLCLAFILRSGKTVYVSSVFSDLNEDSKILLDELGLVFGPNRVSNATVLTSFRLAARW